MRGCSPGAVKGQGGDLRAQPLSKETFKQSSPFRSHVPSSLGHSACQPEPLNFVRAIYSPSSPLSVLQRPPRSRQPGPCCVSPGLLRGLLWTLHHLGGLGWLWKEEVSRVSGKCSFCYI